LLFTNYFLQVPYMVFLSVSYSKCIRCLLIHQLGGRRVWEYIVTLFCKLLSPLQLPKRRRAFSLGTLRLKSTRRTLICLIKVRPTSSSGLCWWSQGHPLWLTWPKWWCPSTSFFTKSSSLTRPLMCMTGQCLPLLLGPCPFLIHMLPVVNNSVTLQRAIAWPVGAGARLWQGEATSHGWCCLMYKS